MSERRQDFYLWHCAPFNKTSLVNFTKLLPVFLRNMIGVAIVFLGVVAMLMGACIWARFHPDDVTSVVGPAGISNRAFIENCTFADPTFVLCASDWPYTFFGPISMESVLYSEDCGARVFWSFDGSVLLVRKDGAFTSAYDYSRHEFIYYDSFRINALVASRGGVGPEQSRYPDCKGARKP